MLVINTHNYNASSNKNSSYVDSKLETKNILKLILAGTSIKFSEVKDVLSGLVEVPPELGSEVMNLNTLARGERKLTNVATYATQPPSKVSNTKAQYSTSTLPGTSTSVNRSINQSRFFHQEITSFGGLNDTHVTNQEGGFNNTQSIQPIELEGYSNLLANKGGLNDKQLIDSEGYSSPLTNKGGFNRSPIDLEKYSNLSVNKGGLHNTRLLKSIDLEKYSSLSISEGDPRNTQSVKPTALEEYSSLLINKGGSRNTYPVQLTKQEGGFNHPLKLIDLEKYSSPLINKGGFKNTHLFQLVESKTEEKKGGLSYV